MRKIIINLVAFLTTLLLLSADCLCAQQVPQNRNWTVQNPKYVVFSSEGIHFLLRDAKEGSDSVTTTLRLRQGKPWKVAFDIQMFPTVNGGMSVHLEQGKTDLCWIGAGDYYKYISGFFGAGSGNMTFDQPWDNNWHSFAYASDGKMLSLWHNGIKCGETNLARTPDVISIQSIGLELRVRNVCIESVSSDVVIARSPIIKNKSQQSQINPETENGQPTYIQPNPLLEGVSNETATDSLTATYNKITSDISSSIIPIIFPDGNAMAFYSYSKANVDTTQKNPVLEYREQSILDTTFDQIDLSQIDIANISLRIMPKDLTDKHYVAQYYVIFIPSVKNAECFTETNSLTGASKVSMTSIYFRDQELAQSFIQHLSRAIHLISQSKSSIIPK